MEKIAIRYVAKVFDGQAAKREALRVAEQFGFFGVEVEQLRRFSGGTSVYLVGQHPQARSTLVVIEPDGPRWLGASSAGTTNG